MSSEETALRLIYLVKHVCRINLARIFTDFIAKFSTMAPAVVLPKFPFDWKI